MSIVARPSCLLCTFSEKLNRLLDHLDNRHMMHDSRSDVLKWVSGS
jgi:hypothetical protein